MKNFLIAQPLMILIVAVALIATLYSVLWAFVGMFAVIAIVIAVLYTRHSRRLRRLVVQVKKLGYESDTLIPISAGGLKVNALVIRDDGLAFVSEKGLQDSIDYDNIEKIEAFIFEATYRIDLKEGASRHFRLSTLKSGQEILNSAANPQAGLGVASIFSLPALSLINATQISMGSSRQRSEALIRALRVATGYDLTIEENFDGSFKKSDLVLGILLGLEIVALVVVGVILFYPKDQL